MDKQTDGQMDGWTNGQMDKRTDGRTDGQKSELSAQKSDKIRSNKTVPIKIKPDRTKLNKTLLALLSTSNNCYFCLSPVTLHLHLSILLLSCCFYHPLVTLLQLLLPSCHSCNSPGTFATLLPFLLFQLFLLSCPSPVPFLPLFLLSCYYCYSHANLL